MSPDSAVDAGDRGYGDEDIIDVCKQGGLRYLLWLRKTANVKSVPMPGNTKPKLGCFRRD